MISQHISYDPSTGTFTWKERPREMFATLRQFRTWNTRYAGKEAGSKVSRDGKPMLVSLKFAKEAILAHRLAWEIVNGPIPESMMVDHRNCNAWDNRIVNLRLATHAENRRNTPMQRNNVSGLKGVCWVKARNCWQARIQVDGIGRHIGHYATKEEAHVAYCKAAEKHHGEFARTA